MGDRNFSVNQSHFFADRQSWPYWHSHRVPCLEGPCPGVMLRCLHLELPNNLQARGPTFLFHMKLNSPPNSFSLLQVARSPWRVWAPLCIEPVCIHLSHTLYSHSTCQEMGSDLDISCHAN